MLSNEYREAMVEVLEILEYSEDNITEKIPKELIDFWNNNKSTTYKPQLDHSKMISEMNLKSKTKAIISMIYLNYLANNKEKYELKTKLKNNRS